MITVVAYSYDIDGTLLFSRGPLVIQEIIDLHHAPLLNLHKSEPHKKYVYCGSTRQTPFHDRYVSAGYNGPLATTLLCEIAKHINAIHNTFLFGDVVVYRAHYDNEMTEGETFEPIFNLNTPGSYHKTRNDLSNPTVAFLDNLKILLIYAQISNLCIHEPDADEIVFNFYDDRLDILIALMNFFEAFPQMMHKKVTLNLWRYSPNQSITTPELIESIHGTCEKIHKNYYAVIQKIIGTDKMTSIYLPKFKQNALALKANEFNKKYIDELVELGTNGEISHQAGEGLNDHRGMYTENTLTPLRDSQAAGSSVQNASRAESHTPPPTFRPN